MASTNQINDEKRRHHHHHHQSPSSSQTSSSSRSHFPLEPTSGATLYELEIQRRAKLTSRYGGGRGLRVGVPEVDDEVLLGGFERGTVVGVSAEVGDFGELFGLQTIAHALVFNPEGITTKPPRPRAAIITMSTVPALVPRLRDVIRSQVQIRLGPACQGDVVDVEVRRCLEQISITRIFDIEGLWEVINEQFQTSPPSPSPSPSQPRPESDAMQDVAATSVSPRVPEEPAPGPPPSSQMPPPSPAPLVLPPLRTHPEPRTEIADSEDEASSPSPSSPVAPPPPPPAVPKNLTSPPLSSLPLLPSSPSTPTPNPNQPPGPKESRIEEATAQPSPPLPQTPEIILITHLSTLLTDLFTRRDKAAAHTTLQLLSSHLRYVARSTGCLFMLLNGTSMAPPQPPPPPAAAHSTTTTTTTTTVPATSITNTTTATAANPATTTTMSAAAAIARRTTNKPPDPTLRSIFHHPPVVVTAGGDMTSRNRNRRKDKPAYGVTFAQFLDLHLLCTRVPRSAADADVLFSSLHPYAGNNNAPDDEEERGRRGSGVRYAWVVEVLLDEMGVWEEEEEGERE
ncbi:hypothetical protein F4778DRAFT_787479 [Xylariomycetidae sp. FL2044]|nr:hypothetical protein F4778DRAFT_787479 [Xylariomycetidae sp. FL2044]